MGIYIFVLCTILVSGFIIANIKDIKNKERTFTILAFLLLTALMALRSPLIGTDSYPYSNMFLRIGEQSTLAKGIDTSGITAPAYVTFCWLLYRVFPCRQAFIVACAIIINFCFFRYIKKMSCNIYLSVFFYMSLAFYIQSFNGARQYIAVGLILNAYTYWIDNKKSLKGWALCLLAILVHSTAFVGIVVIFLIADGEYSKPRDIVKRILSCLAIGCGVVLFQSVFLKLFIKIFPYYSKYLDNDAVHSFFAQGKGRQSIIILGYLAVVILAFYIVRKKEVITKNKILVLQQIPIMLFAVIIGITGATSLAITRMNIFYTAIAICFIPNTLKLFNRKNRYMLTALAILTTTAYLVIFLLEDKSGVIPYRFFWNSL